MIDAAFTGMNAFFTQVKASYPPGGEFNIAHLSAVYDYARYTDLDFGVVLDETQIPNLKNVMTEMTDTLRGISKEDAEKLGASLLFDKSLKGKMGSG